MNRSSYHTIQLGRGSTHLQYSVELTLRFETPEPRIIENMDLHWTSTIGQIREYLRLHYHMPAVRLYHQQQHVTIELTDDNLTFRDLGTRNGRHWIILVRRR